ncbi:MAG: ATP-binding protein [Anaerolineaceae bacterium]|nr:ATP-binding protein [Anaerolineaceae bacterium]
MQPIISLITALPYIDPPNLLLGWLGWFGLLGIIIWACRHWWEPIQINNARQWTILIVLTLAVPFTALFIGGQLPGDNILPLPGVPLDPTAPALMFLSAVPWVLAGGILGPVPALLMGVFSGSMTAMWETHNAFTPLIIGGLALLYSIAIRQRYRTQFYSFLRHPLGASVVLSLAYTPVLLFTAFFAINGSLAVRLDYALTQSWLMMLARGGELVIAGLLAEVFYVGGWKPWGRRTPLQPSPSESSLQVRFFYVTFPLVLGLVLSLTIGDWVVAGNTAKQMIRDRLSSTAQMAANSLPYFLETGQSLIVSLADPALLNLNQTQAVSELSNKLRSVPYYRQLFLMDAQGNPVAGYPINDFSQIRATKEETVGVHLALQGVLMQTYTIPPWPGENSAQISFLAAIRDSTGQIRGVLLGRTDLGSNPFTQPAIQALDDLKSLGGEGAILDENHKILYHPISSLVMSDYTGRVTDAPEFFNDTSLTGTQQLVFYQPVIGRPWAVVITTPAELPQQLALNMALPLLVILLLFSVIIFISLRLSLRLVTASLHTLSQEATLISQGQLDHPLVGQGPDEVGQLSAAFEKMRISLKARLEELNKLLIVSQGVAANLEADEAVEPVLRAAMSEGVSMARIVFVREVTLESGSNKYVTYGFGPASEMYSYMDEQIFDMMRQQDILTISNTMRMRRLSFKPGVPHPGAIIGLALHHESHYYGVLWIAYDQPHAFSEEEGRFLSTLAGEAALAGANARLYANAEIGRQRLEAVLASTPEPVLVINEQMQLLLLNPAAMQIPGLVRSTAPGCPIKDVVGHSELLDLITFPSAEKLSSKEITLSNGKIYFASVAPVVAEGRPFGKVCLLRDISHYKELDSLKSDFVATVSHDLRSPLTLMRGYATMLQMVGELNDQQRGYVRKIVTGVENMGKLVNNLLDLGRIDAGIGLRIEKVDPKMIIEHIVNSLQPQATQKNIQLCQPSSTQAETLIDADPALLQQAVYNLAENAIKYTSVGGQVRINFELLPSMAVFEVHDTGIGIAPLDLPHVFEKFYRSGRREAYQQRGTGLGLAIVKSIAERHGGRVWVESQLGKGSIFYLGVPFRVS